MARELIDRPLTSERSLLLRYGYPFDRIRQALESLCFARSHRNRSAGQF